MPRVTREYKVFVSSPMDVSHERQVVRSSILSASRILSARHIGLKSWLWEEDTVSHFGGSPQEQIIDQLGYYDFYIGLMGKTFGTPTARFGSGTEEEFRRALESYKEKEIKKVGFFFKEEPLSTKEMTEAKLMQLNKVVEFRSSLGPLGLYKYFENDLQLGTLITEFLMDAVDEDLKENPDVTLGGGEIQVLKRKSAISLPFLRDFLLSIDQEFAGDKFDSTLDDLWVELDLKANLFKKDSGIIAEHFDTKKIIDASKHKRCFHITGRETAGKTTICKKLFLALHQASLIPVYLSGYEIKSADIERLKSKISSLLTLQYEEISQENAKTIPRSDIVILLDDLDAIKLSQHLVLKLLSFLKSEFHSVHFTTSVSYSFSVLESTENVAILSEFTRIEIQELGHKKRYDLIENWYRIKSSQDTNVEQIRHKIDQAKQEINRILITHIVPRTPVIVLILLRAFDNNQFSDLAQSGYVRYYKFLIDNAILRNLRTDEAEHAYALLPELAWAVYKSTSGELLAAEAERVVDAFSKKRALRKASLYSVLERLRHIGMFQNEIGVYRFRYPYAYNFFLADYISQRLSDEEMRLHVSSLCMSAWSKEKANILIFLSFHSNDRIITDSLIRQLQSAYKERVEFDFSSKSVEIVNNLILSAPAEIVDQSRAREGRERRLAARDAVKTASAEEEKKSQRRPLNEMESVLASVEVLGHILRNHYARLDAEPKRLILEAVSSAILRCAENFFVILAESQDLVVSILSGALKVLGGDEKKHEAIARTLLFLLLSGFLFYLGKKLSQAVGDENLEITYSQALEGSSALAKKYLGVIIKLDCFYLFPEDELKDLVGLLEGNNVATHALKIAVSERLDMRPPATSSDFQKYCKIVGLQERQRLIERQRQGSKSEKSSRTASRSKSRNAGRRKRA